MFQLYENINTLKLNQDVSQALKNSFSSLESEAKLKDLLKEKENLRFFFIAMLWDKLYTLEENREQLFQFLKLANNLEPLKNTFTSWCD